jgi:GH15 family glucan-1,4-alpha-glucosidase
VTGEAQTRPLAWARPTAESDARARYLPIAEHGIIGDLHTAALVGSEGTIDWFCPDRFDGPSVFGALLDRNRGGFFGIAPRTRSRTPGSSTYRTRMSS